MYGSKLLATAEETINKFGMIPNKDKPLVVAFSGGKDSAATIFALNYLGYKIKPVIIDRGDDPRFNGKNIAKKLKENKNINAEVINLRSQKYLGSICQFAFNDINSFLTKIDSLGENESQCTPCYNARTIALTERAMKYGSNIFVIGQHLSDMVTSLLKCYWAERYFQKITQKEGQAYEGNKMKKFIANNSIEIDYLTKMVEEERAATDDPPVEIINDKVKLIRPLSEVREMDILKFVQDYPYQSSNCTYRETEPRPFRLLVQWDLDKRLRENADLEKILYSLVVKGLNENGTLKFRPRNKRDGYYPGFKPFLKKI